jgi:hypothetical protein
MRLTKRILCAWETDVCLDCSSEHVQATSIFTMQTRLSNAEKLFRATVDVCSSCCRAAPFGGAGVGVGGGKGSSSLLGGAAVVGAGLPGGDVTGTEVVACESLECGVFWQRRRAQDAVVVAYHQTERVLRELDELDF